ncbi:MAG TPA: nucleoside monophosphate kinase [Acidimicrobiales bacterium]|nr:nucleoside monophosphate kinase [Acidimicrobiales bacterium]
MVDVANRAVPRLVMLGRQGSGKGEQSGRLAARLDIEHISTGALLRAAIRDATSLGSAAAEAVERGEPVSDGLVVGLVAERLAVATALGRGVVLDGFPRTAAQAERLAALAPATPIDLAIHLVVPRALAVSRIQSRRVCDSCGWSGRTARCGHCNRPTTRRADDWPAAIGRRMSEHDRQIGPLLDWFGARNALAVVDGVGAPDDVEDRVAEVVGRALEGAHQRSTATAV